MIKSLLIIENFYIVSRTGQFHLAQAVVALQQRLVEGGNCAYSYFEMVSFAKGVNCLFIFEKWSVTLVSTMC
jgi:hypothetical protein